MKYLESDVMCINCLLRTANRKHNTRFKRPPSVGVNGCNMRIENKYIYDCMLTQRTTVLSPFNECTNMANRSFILKPKMGHISMYRDVLLRLRVHVQMNKISMSQTCLYNKKSYRIFTSTGHYREHLAILRQIC